MQRNTNYQRNGAPTAVQGPKKLNWGVVIGAGAVLLPLKGTKTNSRQSYGARAIENRPFVPVTPKSKLNQPYGTGTAVGSVSILKYAVLGGLGIAGCLNLMEGVDWEQLAALGPA